MPDGGNPFFVISETNQPLCSVWVENTDLLSVGREYRLAVFDHRVEDKAIKVESKEQAQSVPSPCTSYALFKDGKFLTNEQQNDKKFLKLVQG